MSAIDINDTTIHSDLNKPINYRSRNLPKLSNRKRWELRNLLSEIRVVVIDEISMASNIIFLHMHQRSCEVFGCNYDTPFAGKQF